MKKNNSEKSISNLFLFVLQELLGIQFETIHEIPLHIAFSYFFSRKDSVDFLDNINFNQENFLIFRNNQQQFIKRISNNITKNKKIVFNNKSFLYSSMYDKIKSIFEKDLETYKNIFRITTTKNIVSEFHTLYVNLVWFHDLTKLEMFDYFSKKSPYLLIFLDCASRSIVYYKLYEEGGENITSLDLINAFDQAISNNPKPTVLHSDSDIKNRSIEIIKAFHQRNIVLSLNRNMYGHRDPKHGNQVIERLNLLLKEIIKKHLKTNFPADFKTLKEIFIPKIISEYHNRAHSNLSTKGLNRSSKNKALITPNEAYTSHSFFLELYDVNFSTQNFKFSNKNLDQIKYLNFLELQDQEKFLDFVFKEINIKNDTEKFFKNFINKSFDSKNSEYQNIERNFQYFFAFAITNGKDAQIKLFFNDSISEFVKGPGRKSKASPEWKLLLSLKESFKNYFQIYNQLLFQFFFKLYYFVGNQLQKNTEEIIKSIKESNDNQTKIIINQLTEQNQLLKEQSENETNFLEQKLNEVKQQNEALKTSLDVMKDQLNHISEIEAKKKEFKEKRKSRIIQKKRDPINITEFNKALSLTEINERQSLSQSFVCSRNRITLYILFFSGIRISSISYVTYGILKQIFDYKKNNKVGIRSTKKKTYEEQIFTVSADVRNKYVFGKFNIINDFYRLIQRHEEWAQKYNLNEEQKDKLLFFTNYNTLDKVCARQHINTTMNKIIKQAEKIVNGNGKKAVKLLTTHSFRINVVTSILKKYKNIRLASLFVNHSNISTTALYDRNILSIKQQKEISDFLIDTKTYDTEEGNSIVYETAVKLLEEQNVDEIFTTKSKNLEEAYLMKPSLEDAKKTERHIRYKNKNKKI